MTAVASPPSLQPLQRLSWNGEDEHNDTSAVSTEEVSRIFLPRKGPQRSNSSSSSSSISSANTTISTNPSTDTAATEASAIGFVGVGRGGRASGPGFEKDSWSGTRKTKSIWSGTRTEGAFTGTLGSGRSLNFSSASSESGLAGSQSIPIASSNTMQNVQQAGGGRVLSHAGGNEPQALLILVPTNGTFDRKSISVPLFPEILRIGRQTNAKTIPTSTNGYFDSKVLSRQHAEVWADRNGKIWIRDVKSSNGTFVNGQRLSPESRDSEPHELRENDSLELGIDIVSEDQKSIVHHKVSAKVEHAGFPNSSANVMDLTYGDLDPGASNGLLASMPNGLVARPRLGSQGSSNSNGSRADSQAALRGPAAFGVQRHMNSFLSPVSVETIMRKLNTELRQAKQQSQDLNRTSEFFKALIATEPGKEPPKAPASILPPKPPPTSAHSLPNGLIAPTKLDHLSPFSAPPAPPPQLPLPEKPDAPRSAHVESTSSLPFKRSSVDSSHLTNGKSDNSGQILSLVETLQSTKRELDKQGNRVKELEELLKREREAREVAEERARLLSHRQDTHVNGFETETASSLNGSEEEALVPIVNGIAHSADEFSDTGSDAETTNGDANSATKTLDGITHMDRINAKSSIVGLQEKLNKLMQEMEDVRRQLDQQRHRADTAETERDNLVDMVQRIRQAEVDARSSPRKTKAVKAAMLHDGTNSNTLNHSGQDLSEANSEGDDELEEVVRQAEALVTMNGKPPGPTSETDKDRQIRELQESLALALARARKGEALMHQSTPYMSVIGVVVLGVSAMLYLNSLQKLEK